jgi:hypothetical protein
MKVLIDGSSKRLAERRAQADWLVGGQFLTPLTGYKLAEKVFGIDNGAFSGMTVQKIAKFTRLLARYYDKREDCLFVAVPDKVADHKESLVMWDRYNHLADGYTKAFVVQNGFDGAPSEAGSVFIGGDNDFKDSNECYDIVKRHIAVGMHVHIGRVTGFKRFIKFHEIGAHTCDGSGLSMYDGTFQRLSDALLGYL